MKIIGKMKGKKVECKYRSYRGGNTKMISDMEALGMMLDELTNKPQNEQFMPIIRKLAALIQLAEDMTTATDLDLIRLRIRAREILEA